MKHDSSLNIGNPKEIDRSSPRLQVYLQAPPFPGTLREPHDPTDQNDDARVRVVYCDRRFMTARLHSHYLSRQLVNPWMSTWCKCTMYKSFTIQCLDHMFITADGCQCDLVIRLPHACLDLGDLDLNTCPITTRAIRVTHACLHTPIRQVMTSVGAKLI